MRRSGMFMVGLLIVGSSVYFPTLQISDAERREVILPVVANGIVDEPRHLQSTFSFLNFSESEVEAFLEVYDDEGHLQNNFLQCSPIVVEDSEVRLSFSPSGSVHQGGITATELINGWARLSWTGTTRIEGHVEVALIDDDPVPCLLVCNRPSTQIVTSLRMPARKPAKGFRSQVIITQYRDSALAIVNPSPSESGTLKLTLVDSEGQIFRDTNGVPAQIEEYSLAPMTRVAQFAWEFFDACDPAHQICAAVTTDPTPAPDMFHGSIRIESDVAIVVGAVQVLLPEGRFVHLPVQVLVEL